MMECAQAAAANILAKRAHIAHHFWSIANQTDTGRAHQESHDQQEPPAVIHMPDGKFIEELEPEGAKLVDIDAGDLILLKHGTNNAGHADKHQQANCKAHLAKHLDQICTEATQSICVIHEFEFTKYCRTMRSSGRPWHKGERRRRLPPSD